MFSLRQVSLRHKLVLGIMGTALLALFLELAGFLAIEASGSRTSAERELAVLAEVLAQGATAPLDFHYPVEAETLLGSLRAQPAIEAARIYDRRGLPFATYRRDPLRTQPLPITPPEGGLAFTGQGLWLARPVRHAGELLGTLYLRSDLSGRAARLRWTIGLAMGLTLVLAAMATLFALKVGRVVARPILELAEAARWVGEGSDLRRRVVNRSGGEVGLLVGAFNRMLDQLGERQARLEEAQRMARLGSWSLRAGADAAELSTEVRRLLFGVDSGPTLVPLARLEELVDPEDAPGLREGMVRARQGTAAHSQDLRVTRADGSVRWVHLSAAAFRDGEDRILFRGTLMDITERKAAETSLRQVQKLESLGVLAGGIAHDFNNLLGAILGNLGLARMHVEEASRADHHLKKSEEITLKAAELTRQMLAYSGKGRFEHRSLDLNLLVREMGDLLSVSISKKAALSYQLCPEGPALLGDPAQLHQVVMNLVINASEALGDGAGVIRLRTGLERLMPADLATEYLGQELDAGDYAVLEVEDDGCGMDAATLERMFDPFFTTKFSGRGLGLAAMLGILKGHRGGIRVLSEPGRGTTFKLLFPAAGTPAPAAEPAPVPVAGPCSGLALVVDDEPELLAMAVAVLEDMGLEVLTAGDGREALDRFEQHHARLCCVLLDLTMPRMDGSEAFRAMHGLDPAVPVILSSGFNQKEIRDTFVEENMSRFLQKPYRPADLTAMVRELLGQGRGQP